MRKVNRVVRYGMERDLEEEDGENRDEEVWGEETLTAKLEENAE